MIDQSSERLPNVIVVCGFRIVRIFPTGVTAYAFGRTKFIRKHTSDWRVAFGICEQLPLTPEQRSQAVRLGLFFHADGSRVTPPPLAPAEVKPD